MVGQQGQVGEGKPQEAGWGSWMLLQRNLWSSWVCGDVYDSICGF